MIYFIDRVVIATVYTQAVPVRLGTSFTIRVNKSVLLPKRKIVLCNPRLVLCFVISDLRKEHNDGIRREEDVIMTMENELLARYSCRGRNNTCQIGKNGPCCNKWKIQKQIRLQLDWQSTEAWMIVTVITNKFWSRTLEMNIVNVANAANSSMKHQRLSTTLLTVPPLNTENF